MIAAVAVGGAIGSVARYLIAGWVQSAAWAGFPMASSSVNISGGLVMGVLTELMALKFNVSLEMRAFLTTGILGGYTTFSTFSLDSALLIERGAYASAASYIVGSAMLSIVALFCGPLDRARASMPELRTIAQDDDGIRLDRWFKRHYPALTHGRLEKLLRKGEVRLDGKRAKAADRVAAGQTLRLPPQVIHDKVRSRGPSTPAPVERPRAAWKIAILYMDKHLFVLEQAGRAWRPRAARASTSMSTACWISSPYEKPTRPKLVHRLDRDTSGVLLVARTAQAASGLSASSGQPRRLQSLLGAGQRRAQGEARRDQGGAGQGRRARQGRAHGDRARMTTPNSPSPNMP